MSTSAVSRSPEEMLDQSHGIGETESTELSPRPALSDFNAAPVENAPRDQNNPNRSGITVFWKRHISLSVSPRAARDHLANERTYLGYLRTSQATAIVGVFITQLFRLNSTPRPDLGYYAISEPLAAVCHGFAIAIAVIGMVRFFRFQNEMHRGYSLSGGWEIWTVGALCGLMMLALFILAMTLDIDDEDD